MFVRLDDIIANARRSSSMSDALDDAVRSGEFVTFLLAELNAITLPVDEPYPTRESCCV